MKALVGAFNQEKALVGAFSVIVQLHRLTDLRHYFKPSNYAPTTIYFVSGWDWEDHGLGEAKSAFGIVKLPDGLLDDPNCSK